MKAFGLRDKETLRFMGVDVYCMDEKTCFALEFSEYSTVFLWTTDNEHDAKRVADESTSVLSSENSFMYPENVFCGRLEVVELFDTQD